MSMNFDTLFGPYQDKVFVNYDWTDIDSATGYVVYDGFNTREGLASYYHLAKSDERYNLWSYDLYTAETGDYQVLSKVLDLDFTTSTFQKERKVRGDGFLKVPFLHADATMSQGYIVAILKKGAANPYYPSVTEAHGVSLPHNQAYTSNTDKYGFKITTNHRIQINYVTKYMNNPDYATTCYILDSSKTVIYTSSPYGAGTTATFANAILETGTTYYIVNSGISGQNMFYEGAGVSYPVDSENINYTGGYSDGTDNTAAYSVFSVNSQRLMDDDDTETEIVTVTSNIKTSTGAKIFNMTIPIPETIISVGERLKMTIEVWVKAGDASSTVTLYHNPRDSSETGYTGGNARLVFICPFKIEDLN